MKAKLMIIEDNVYRMFTTKQLLESQLNLPVQVVGVTTDRELRAATASLTPDMVIVRPKGGVIELMAAMKKRNVNRRNTEVTLVMATAS